MIRDFVIVSLVLLVWSTLRTELALAGVSPENVIVVVNADSYESRTVANQYAQLREIPSGNLIFLEGVPSDPRIGLEPFKEQILRPVLSEIEKRGLAKQARVIAYSTNFPTKVDIKEHKAKLPDSPINKFITPQASINGLTYLYRFVLADNPQYLDLSSNLYCRGPFNRNFTNPFLDVEHRQRFKDADEAFKISDFSKAAEEFEKLFEESPRMPALAIRAAEAREKAGDHSAAKNLIVKAISAGWTSATWLDENQSLSPLMKERPLSSLANRLSTAPIDMQGPVGFSSQVAWNLSGQPAASVDLGIPYMLSCMLGVVNPRAAICDK